MTDQSQVFYRSICDPIGLLPSAWPSDSLPTTSAALLAIASRRGLVAAASPDRLILAPTSSLRGGDTSSIRSIDIPRCSHIVFSSDESYLALSAEQGGGLAVYKTDDISTPALEISTQGEAIRQLLPNPSVASSHLFAIVTAKGNVLLADLQQPKLLHTAQDSPVFHTNALCASWSRLGKQIIVGLQDGTAAQIDQQGALKATIPLPPSLDNAIPLTSIYWLETHEFLLIHTPEMDDDSFYHLAQRDKTTNNWSFSKFAEPTPPFGLSRKPAHHFIQRFKDWPPNMSDILVLASTASSDIGMFTKAKTPLDDTKVVDTWTTTASPDNSRPAMPLSQDGISETSPIGMAIDLSATEKISRPIPNDELEQSPIELPALYVLSNEGQLSMWWVVYKDSVKSAQHFPDLVAGRGSQSQPATAVPAPPSQVQASLSPATPSVAPSFGNSSFGAPQSPWGSGNKGSAFGQPSFGSASFGQQSKPAGTAPAFGQASMGFKTSPWGTQQTAGQHQAPIFGAPTSKASPFSVAGSENKASPFASVPSSGSNSTASPFGAFASNNNNNTTTSPFAANTATNMTSPFAKNIGNESTSPFALNNTTSSTFGTFGSVSHNFSSTPASTTGTSGKPSESKEEDMADETPNEQPSSFSGFNLGSTFKNTAAPQPETKQDDGKPQPQDTNLFGTDFGTALQDTTNQPHSKKASNDAGSGIEQTGQSLFGAETREIPTGLKASQPSSTAFGNNLFGVQQKQPESKSLFGGFTSSTADKTANSLFGKPSSDPPIKKEPSEEGPNLKDIPEAPVDDAPLPPDPTTWKPKPGYLPPPIPPGFENQSATDPPAPQTLNTPALPEGDDDDVASDVDEEDYSEDGEASVPNDFDSPSWSEEDGEESYDEDDDEGSWVEDDDVEDESPDVTDQQGLSAFQARISKPESTTPASKVASSSAPTPSFKAQPKQTPSQDVPAISTTDREIQSPRSPSPLPASKGSPALPESIAVPAAQPTKRTSRRPRPSPEVKAAPTISLEDREDERVRQLLNTPAESTRDLPPLITHQDYVSNLETDKTGLSAQIELVYRDINSMIDTFGLNARALQGFIQGHKDSRRDGERTRDEIEDESNWVMPEAEDLQYKLEFFQAELDHVRLEDISSKMEVLRQEETNVNRVRSSVSAIRKDLATRSDPELRSRQLNNPLPMQSQAQQSDLRQAVYRVQKLLTKSEEVLSVLRADLASSSRSTHRPTVEAITNTILKMTAMVERKSGDIDVLEAQIKRLGGLPPAGLQEDYEDDLASAFKASKLAPVAARNSFRTSLTASPRRQLRSSVIGTPRKSLVELSDEELQLIQQKKESRRKMNSLLRETLVSHGPRVVKA